jgi:3-oxoacyl-[acyl-carrier-protein] synthase II
MEPRRVVITGMGAVGALGTGVAELCAGLDAGRCATRRMEGWESYRGLRSLVGAPVDLKNEKAIPRQARRSMSRMSVFAVQAGTEALADAGLSVADGPPDRVACVIGSTLGSSISLADIFRNLTPPDGDIGRLTSMQFFQCLSHTAAMNAAHYFGITGTVTATCSACASSMQAIGAAYELIRTGGQDAALCGGAEELHPMVTAAFDVLYAASRGFNDAPLKTPRPFDRDRDGLVCGEGSGLVVLEDRDRALRRGARIHAEILGYHTCSSAEHISQSSRRAIVECMSSALRKADVTPGQVDYVNAHATATAHGDAEEAAAIREVFGGGVPVSSLKGYFGHAMGAAGSLELIASLAMAARGIVCPTLNLEHVAPECEGLSHVTEKTPARVRLLLKNGFAFGGINATLVCRRPE